MSGVVAIANAIPDMRAMTSLNLSSNHMGKLVAQTATHQVLLKQLRSQGMALKDAMAQVAQLEDSPLGILALADAIKGNGALIKLDISSNQIGAKQEWHLQRICVAGGIELAS
jgi:hypothetical protein